MNFLHAAYAATWIIHISYLAILFLGYRRVRKQVEELRKSQ
jgi:hypothetical protein